MNSQAWVVSLNHTQWKPERANHLSANLDSFCQIHALTQSNILYLASGLFFFFREGNWAIFPLYQFLSGLQSLD